MNTAEALNDFARARSAQLRPELCILIMHDDQAIGWSAMQMCERLIEKFNDEFLFRVKTESLGALENEARFRQSIAEARNADMIFIGAAGDPPAKFRDWLKESVESGRRDTPVALVDMTLDTAPRAEEVHELLRSAADAHHLDLIVNAPPPEAKTRPLFWTI